MKENLKIKELLKNFTLKRSTSALIKKPSKSITTTNSTLISNSKRKSKAINQYKKSSVIRVKTVKVQPFVFYVVRHFVNHVTIRYI